MGERGVWAASGIMYMELGEKRNVQLHIFYGLDFCLIEMVNEFFFFLCRNAQWTETLQYGPPYKGLGGQDIAKGKDSKVKRGVDD